MSVPRISEGTGAFGEPSLHRLRHVGRHAGPTSCDAVSMSEQPGQDRPLRSLVERVGAGEFDAWFRPDNAAQRRTEGERAFFLLLAEVVRAEHDPATDWEGFCAQLWAWTDAAFEITPQEQSWPEEVPRPWWLHRDDPPALSWDAPDA